MSQTWEEIWECTKYSTNSYLKMYIFIRVSVSPSDTCALSKTNTGSLLTNMVISKQAHINQAHGAWISNGLHCKSATLSPTWLLAMLGQQSFRECSILSENCWEILHRCVSRYNFICQDIYFFSSTIVDKPSLKVYLEVRMNLTWTLESVDSIHSGRCLKYFYGYKKALGQSKWKWKRTQPGMQQA
jgi:hypothetical protein